MSQVLGIHHVTAIASDPQRNLDFYAGVLGLRLVKRTVNFDDPQTYHFYFGDETGTPGTILTFFPWPRARSGRVGLGQIAVTSFAIVPSSVGFWIQRLISHNVAYEGPLRGDALDQGPTIRFRDHDGLVLELVADPAAEAATGWGGAHGISPDEAIRGFHHVTAWVEHGDATERTLVDTLGFSPIGERGTVRRYAAGAGGPGTIIDVRAAAGFVPGTGGAGTIHHVAWNVADDAAEHEMRERVLSAGLRPTPVIDRQYFHSVYFREPGGVLYELATSTPGFTIDEPVERLGEQLMLPPRYEPHRSEIESVLPRIHLPRQPAGDAMFADVTGPEDVSGEALGFIHRYLPPTAAGELAGGTTLLLLHGTGGDEHDLIPLGRALLPGAGMLSPRGKVLERGAPRFFRRLSEGVFDQEDLARRTDELAQFVAGAAETYQLDRGGIVAVGFSNGANIAASLMLRRPGVVCAAVLLSPMVPFELDTLPDLSGTAVFIGAGRNDPIVRPEQTERLAELLGRAGAEVVVHWEPGGHAVSESEVEAARRWLAGVISRGAPSAS